MSSAWVAEIEAAAERVASFVRRTPCVQLEVPGVVQPVTVKLEQMQHTGTFKVRGAFQTLLSLDELPRAGVVAASGGNHGAAVAYAARRLGLPARIYVPEGAPEAKVALIRRSGAECLLAGGNYAAAYEASLAYQSSTGALAIHAYDGLGTVVGQGTVAWEWEDQGLAADTVLIAVGGGGLIAGSLAWYGGRRRVVAVEAEGSPTLHTALREGPQAKIQPRGLAKDSLGASTIGSYCYELASMRETTSVLVSPEAIRAAQKLLWEELRCLVEPGGATALAGLLEGAYRPQAGERVAVLVCGGNIDPDPLASPFDSAD